MIPTIQSGDGPEKIVFIFVKARSEIDGELTVPNEVIHTVVSMNYFPIIISDIFLPNIDATDRSGRVLSVRKVADVFSFT